MAKKRKRSLGYVDVRRFVVVGRSGRKRVYTNIADAMTVAKRCSNNKTGKACKVLHGLVGTERLIATCTRRRCKTPGGKSISMKKLYDAEQSGLKGARRKRRR